MKRNEKQKTRKNRIKGKPEHDPVEELENPEDELQFIEGFGEAERAGGLMVSNRFRTADPGIPENPEGLGDPQDFGRYEADPGEPQNSGVYEVDPGDWMSLQGLGEPQDSGVYEGAENASVYGNLTDFQDVDDPDGMTDMESASYYDNSAGIESANKNDNSIDAESVSGHKEIDTEALREPYGSRSEEPERFTDSENGTDKGEFDDDSEKLEIGYVEVNYHNAEYGDYDYEIHDNEDYDYEVNEYEDFDYQDLENDGLEYIEFDNAPQETKEHPIISVQDVTMNFKVPASAASGIKEYIIQKINHQMQFRELVALNHVSFDILPGEVVGLIGTNGSGKSTLLRIVSGALEPTGGKVLIDRRKVQLLTLGTGFDMELSARENVYLNGSIIGYSKEFLDTHYNEIVEFAELDGFMDERVKNFSSGMVSRLGFAIATAGDAAEILILDEVLSVGDEFFRKKSLKRIKEMIHGGSTVIMVSHGMGTILENCTKVVWIEKGVLQMVGDAETVCAAYRRMNG